MQEAADNRHGCVSSKKWCDWFGALHYASTKHIFYLAIITILLASAKIVNAETKKNGVNTANYDARQTTTNIISSSWMLMSFR